MIDELTETLRQEALLARHKAERERDELATQLEEARDTIERLVEEKRGITRQRDELKRQFDRAIAENLVARREIAELIKRDESESPLHPPGAGAN